MQSYHKFLAWTGAVWYGYPARDLIVIGVTGTVGKTTTGYYIAKILERAGFKVGLTSTSLFKIGEKEWLNSSKQTMLGRFQLQKYLRKMVRQNCQYAIIETSSEGIIQHRARYIDYDVAVFTNLSPEHIEAHGSYENYRRAKGELFASLAKSTPKQANNQNRKRPVQKTAVVNLDDKEARYFLSFPVDEKITFALKESDLEGIIKPTARGSNIRKTAGEISFQVDLPSQSGEVKLRTDAEFNVVNALAAIASAFSQGIKLPVAIAALSQIEKIPGRMEKIDVGQNFAVYVDYAHEPKGLASVYLSLKELKPRRLIAVLGSAGGGRDKSKRPLMGKIAGESADLVIVTNEDPYDEDPQKIIDQVASGVLSTGKKLNENCFVVPDRYEALKKALSEAREGDIVIATGKGSEQFIASKNNKKIPWDEREKVKEILAEFLNNKS